MALRIGPTGGGTPPEELPAEEMQALPEEMPVEPMAPEMSSGTIDPMVARYLGPESRCGGCVHFLEGMEGGTCELVSVPIDPMGVCMLFVGDTPDELPMDSVPEGEVI